MSRLGNYVTNLMPAPVAAPESPALRRARVTLIVELVALAAIVGFWPPIHYALGIVAVAAIIGLVVKIAVQGVCYITAKRRADDEWLFAQIAERRELDLAVEEGDR